MLESPHVNPLETYRSFKETKLKADVLRSEVSAKLRELSNDSLFGVEAQLTQEQSQRLSPLVNGIEGPFEVFIGTIEGGYQCQLRRDPIHVSLVISKRETALALELRDVRADRWYQQAASVSLSGDHLRKSKKAIHALEVGNRLATALLEIRNESPGAFREIPLARKLGLFESPLEIAKKTT
jgi:hypothetical protein